MGSELRKVCEDWKHPKKDNGEYQPLLNEFYGKAVEEWYKNHKLWLQGQHPDQIEFPEETKKYPFYAMWTDNFPDVDYYQKKDYQDSELTHIQLYETTTEGTPISPVFKADEFEKLCEYAAEHCSIFGRFKATKQEWMDMLDDGNFFHQER